MASSNYQIELSGGDEESEENNNRDSVQYSDEAVRDSSRLPRELRQVPEASQEVLVAPAEVRIEMPPEQPAQANVVAQAQEDEAISRPNFDDIII